MFLKMMLNFMSTGRKCADNLAIYEKSKGSDMKRKSGIL